MESKRLVLGQAYLLRFSGNKQVPVRFAGRQERFHDSARSPRQFLVLESLDGNDTYYRASARMLSKHYDSCARGWNVPEALKPKRCNCALRLAMLEDPA